jgi:hypothetical protein
VTQQAQQGLSHLAAPPRPAARVFLHYDDPQLKGDMGSFVTDALAKASYRVSGTEQVASGYRPMVKYFFEADRNDAQAVADIVLKVYARRGISLDIQPQRADDPNARPGLIEVWLPAKALEPHTLK